MIDPLFFPGVIAKVIAHGQWVRKLEAARERRNFLRRREVFELNSYHERLLLRRYEELLRPKPNACERRQAAVLDMTYRKIRKELGRLQYEAGKPSNNPLVP